MPNILLWIVLSLGVGMVAGVFAARISHHRRPHHARRTDHEVEVEGDLDEIDSSPTTHILFVVMVFAVMAFLFIWLITALCHPNGLI